MLRENTISVKEYLAYAKFTSGKGSERGASVVNNMYWRFLGEEIFMSDVFVPSLKLAMVGVNIYYFFIRRWCLPQCFS